jgi:hypothetical protein
VWFAFLPEGIGSVRQVVHATKFLKADFAGTTIASSGLSHSTFLRKQEGVAMKKHLGMIMVLVDLSATMMADADRTLRTWHLVDDRGRGLILWLLLIIVILTSCTPY